MTNPFSPSIDVRFRILDAMGHLNHAVSVSYLETARNDVFLEALDVSLNSVNTALAHPTADFQDVI